MTARSHAARAGCLMAVGAALVVAGCGGSAVTSVAVPRVAGLGLSDAATRLCRAGVAVAVNETRQGRSGGAPGARAAHGALVVTGTTPPAGTVVATRSVVTLNVTAPIGVFAIIRLPSSCTGQASSS